MGLQCSFKIHDSCEEDPSRRKATIYTNQSCCKSIKNHNHNPTFNGSKVYYYYFLLLLFSTVQEDGSFHNRHCCTEMRCLATLLLLQCIRIPGSHGVKPASDFIQSDALDQGILDWIDSLPNGFFNEKQEFRKVSNEPNSVSGVMAKERIEQGEVLLRVPWSAMITSEDPTESGQLCCGTVASLARELKLGSQSNYAPWISYLQTQSYKQLPSAWSEQGKNILRHIVGGMDVFHPELPPEEPVEWLDNDFQECVGQFGIRDNERFRRAALLTIQRSDDAIIIPGYDLYNHRNGAYLNTETTTYENEYVEVKASRLIEPGEQIHNTYNMCKECRGRWMNYGTPGKYLLRG